MIGDRWGVTESETLRWYPCDDFVASPALQAWRGVRVEAPASVVWPWVTTYRAAGWYRCGVRRRVAGCCQA